MNILNKTQLNNVSHVFKRGLSKIQTGEYCIESVKKYDYENYLTTLLLQKEARACAFAIRSFNVEVSRISEQASQKGTALMRFQFWEDTLNKCYLKGDIKDVPHHPVAFELHKAIDKHKLSKRNLLRLITSRNERLELNHYHTLDELEKYLDQSISSVYYLMLEGCSVRDVNADHAASHLGKAQGLVQHLKNVPLSRKLNLIPLPQDTLLKYNLSFEDILRGRSSQQMSDCIYEVASRAHGHVTKAKKLLDTVPSAAKKVFLSEIAITSYLDRLQKVDYNVFDQKLKYRPWNLLFKIWLQSYK